MVCLRVQQLADAFLSGELRLETTQAVVAHLERCPACEAEIDGVRRLRAATRSAFERAPEFRMDPAFAAALNSHLHRVGRAPVPRTQPRAWMTIAASILLLVAAAWGWRASSTAGLSSVLHAAVADHRFCALTYKFPEHPLPVEAATGRYDGTNGLFEKVEPSTSTLSGGLLLVVERHSCEHDGRRFAHVILRYKHETVSLLVTSDVGAHRWLPSNGTSEHATAVVLPVTDGFEVTSLRGPRQVAFVISSLAHADAQEVAAALVKPLSKLLAGG
jgi:Putative zinc-finger